VFGSGTLLDTARLHWRLAEHLETDIDNVEGIVMGEHGDSEFVAWSTVHCTRGICEADDKDRIEEETRKAAYEIIAGKGATFFGIGAAAAHILRCVLHDTEDVLPVSTVINGEYGLHGVALGVPAVIGEGGVKEVVELELTEYEIGKLHHSAQTLQSYLKA
jgi:L-lactate dehydrogenase